MNLLRQFGIAVLLVALVGSIAEARLSRVVKQPAASPSDQAAPATPAPATAAPVHSCAPVCCKKMEIILQVKDPCTCCLIEVPVCIPECCTGNPTVCCRCGFLGRTIVEYHWACGVSVEVVFKRNGCYFVRYCGC